MPLKNNWVNGDLFTPAAANDMANAVNNLNIVTNVKDYGATGLGTFTAPDTTLAQYATRETNAIHAARDAAGVGGKLFFPAGTYLVSGLTASVANQTWELADSATVKMATGASAILSVTGAGVSVTGGAFDGSNGTNVNTQSGLSISANGVSVRNVTVQDSPSYGIRASGYSQLTVSDCTITNSALEGIFYANFLTAPSSISDILITNNLIESSEALTGGIYVRGNSPTQRVKDVIISGNTVRVPSNPEAETGGIIVFYGTDYIVAHNIVAGGSLGITCPGPIRASISGNMVRGFRDMGIEIPGDVNQCVISGNVVDADGAAGFSGVQTSQGNVNDLTISGNTIEGFTVAGPRLIDFNSGSVPDRVAIIGNVLRSNVATFVGIWFNVPVLNVMIAANVIDGASSTSSCGVQLNNGATGLTVSGNHFSNLAAGAIVLASGVATAQDYISLSANAYINCGAVILNANYGSGASALGVNVSTEIAPILGTPKSGTLTNCTGLPVSGITASTSAAIGVGSINLGHATDTTLSRSAAGKLAVEGVDVLLSGGALGTPSSGTLTNCTGLAVSGITASTSTALGVGSIELGHATDTTLTRSAAGMLAVEGIDVALLSGAQTLTGKRITSRINSTASSATPSINTDTTDQFNITALATAITSMTSGLSGTPTDGQKLLVRIKDNGTARAITWGASFVSSGVATLPTTTVISKTHLVGLIYDSAAAKWVCAAADGSGY
jgi:hypothetical protein